MKSREELWHLTQNDIASVAGSGIDARNVLLDGIPVSTEGPAVGDEEKLLLREAVFMRRRIWCDARIVPHGGEEQAHRRYVGHDLAQRAERGVASVFLHQFVVETRETLDSFGVLATLVVTPIPREPVDLHFNLFPARIPQRRHRKTLPH